MNALPPGQTGPRCPRCERQLAPGTEVCDCGYPQVLVKSVTSRQVAKPARRPLEPAGDDPAPPMPVEAPHEPATDVPAPADDAADAVVCEQCGQANDRARTWCSRCGHLLVTPAPSERVVPVAVRARPWWRSRALWVVTILVLCAGAGAWLAQSVLRGEAPPQVLEVADVTASSTAEPSRDAQQVVVSFDARQVVDGDLTTAWRAPGTVGHELVLRLDERSEVTAVQIVPGYAKTDLGDGTDRFEENHTVTEVLWLFDGDSSVVQRIAAPSRAWVQQTLPEAVTTSTVTVRITGTGNPGAARDFTAVSEVRVLGRPAS